MNVLQMLATMYVTLMGPVLAGIINSLWCKLKVMKKLQIPMDGGKSLKDGKRIFGDHKTWKGFIGYIIWNVVCMVVWGLICKVAGLEHYNMLYTNYENTITFNLAAGGLVGFGYALFELPNSFLKRRLGIEPGKSMSGMLKAFFVFFDQADSVFGCVLVVCIFAPMSVGFYFLYVVVGAVTHIIINMLLYACKLRKNMF